MPLPLELGTKMHTFAVSTSIHLAKISNIPFRTVDHMSSVSVSTTTCLVTPQIVTIERETIKSESMDASMVFMCA